MTTNAENSVVDTVTSAVFDMANWAADTWMCRPFADRVAFAATIAGKVNVAVVGMVNVAAVGMVTLADSDMVSSDSGSSNCNRTLEIGAACTGHNTMAFYFCC